MSILEVLTWPDPILKKKSLPVTTVSSELKLFSQDMLETMYKKNGIGLAAPQVGKNVRLIVVDTRPRDDDEQVVEEEMTDLERAVTYPLILFNPIVTKKIEKTTFEEGCLSVPGFNEVVTRSRIVNVEAMGLDGKPIKFQTDGLLAICIQHEIDHLDGKLFIDRLSALKSEMIKSKIKKHGYPKPKGHSSTL